VNCRINVHTLIACICVQASYHNQGVKRLHEAVMSGNVDEIRRCISENATMVNIILEVCLHIFWCDYDAIMPLCMVILDLLRNSIHTCDWYDNYWTM
jgi:hypothetical protein